MSFTKDGKRYETVPVSDNESDYSRDLSRVSQEDGASKDHNDDIELARVDPDDDDDKNPRKKITPLRLLQFGRPAFLSSFPRHFCLQSVPFSI